MGSNMDHFAQSMFGKQSFMECTTEEKESVASAMQSATARADALQHGQPGRIPRDSEASIAKSIADREAVACGMPRSVRGAAGGAAGSGADRAAGAAGGAGGAAAEGIAGNIDPSQAAAYQAGFTTGYSQGYYTGAATASTAVSGAVMAAAGVDTAAPDMDVSGAGGGSDRAT